MSRNLVDLVLRYFPFLASGVTLFNLWTVRSRVSRAAKICLASFSGLFLTWGLLQTAGGYGTFFFILLPPNNHPLVAIFWAIYFISLWGCTAWVIWGNGAEELLRSGMVHGREGLKRPQYIKLFFAITSILLPLLVILGYASNVFGKVITALEQMFPN